MFSKALYKFNFSFAYNSLGNYSEHFDTITNSFSKIKYS